MDISNNEFIKIINDFTNDLENSFPELKEKFTNIDYNLYYSYCKNLYPENFFNILYENKELFDNEENKYLLPDIDFKKIMNDESLSEKSKKMIWKYVQLILFSVCNNLKNKDDFGDANYLFEAIKEDELHEKIEQTMNEMKNIFMNINEDTSQNIFENMMNEDMFKECISGENPFENIFKEGVSGENPFENMFKQGVSGENPFENTMDPENLKSHLSGILDGKIGNLAKEIAQEATKELGVDESMSQSDQQDFMKNLFKNPTKLMDIVKNIGSKLENKFKSGELKESELMEEAQEIMGKMNDMPGLKEMMSSMGMNPNGKFDFKGMANKMQQNMKSAKTKERMKEKLEKNKKEKLEAESLGTIKEINEDTFVWNDSNSDSKEPLKKSKKPNNKKKKKKKKN